MLIISRKKMEKIIIADDIEITILEVGRNRVRFGIQAPKDVPINTHLKATPLVREITVEDDEISLIPAAAALPHGG